MNWITAELESPTETGLYKVRFEHGEGEAFYVRNLLGGLVWLAPEHIKVIEWAKK